MSFKLPVPEIVYFKLIAPFTGTVVLSTDALSFNAPTAPEKEAGFLPGVSCTLMVMPLLLSGTLSCLYWYLGPKKVLTGVASRSLMVAVISKGLSSSSPVRCGKRVVRFKRNT